MDQLARHVLRIINCERHGGRILRMDETTIVLYDCGYWSDAHSQVIQTKFPECEICYQPSAGSLSGFVIVFRLKTDTGAWYWVAITLGILAGLMWTVRRMIQQSGTI